MLLVFLVGTGLHRADLIGNNAFMFPRRQVGSNSESLSNAQIA